MANAQTAVDLEYVKTMIFIYGFSLEFVAKDLGIQLESLQRRIDRAKRRGEW